MHFFFFLINKLTDFSLNRSDAQVSYIIQQLILNDRWVIFHPNTTVSYNFGILCHDMSCRIYGSADMFYFPWIKTIKIHFYTLNHLLDRTNRTLSAKSFYDNLGIALYTNLVLTLYVARQCNHFSCINELLVNNKFLTFLGTILSFSVILCLLLVWDQLFSEKKIIRYFWEK